MLGQGSYGTVSRVKEVETEKEWASKEVSRGVAVVCVCVGGWVGLLESHTFGVHSSMSTNFCASVPVAKSIKNGPVRLFRRKYTHIVLVALSLIQVLFELITQCACSVCSQ